MNTKEQIQRELARLQVEQRDLERVIASRQKRMHNRVERINNLLKQL